ncbi:MAG TPA: enoyl-CoA hydratase-related protein [bacterium]|jgi:methylglutaconyl-CoA hydratase
MSEQIINKSIIVEIDPPVAKVTLNRPDARNALNPQMLQEIIEALKLVEQAGSVRALVITGTGDVFCAGGDIKWFMGLRDKSREEVIEEVSIISECMVALYECPLPTIAIVNGHAFGGGCGLAAACDFSIASEDAMFSVSEVKLGMIPSPLIPIVVKKLGEARSRRLMLSGTRFTAKEAQEYGLIGKVFPRVELAKCAEPLINTLVKGSPNAIAETKRLIRELPEMKLEDTHGKIAEALADVILHDEAGEGMRAFYEKREPEWR